MKKMIFASLLFGIGSLGVIALIAAAIISPNPWSINWHGNINIAFASFILFGLMGIAGLAICAVEVFRKEKE